VGAGLDAELSASRARRESAIDAVMWAVLDWLLNTVKEKRDIM
jgi:hypothetical protein